MKNLLFMNRGSKLKKEKQLTKVQCLLIFIQNTVLTHSLHVNNLLQSVSIIRTLKIQWGDKAFTMDTTVITNVTAISHSAGIDFEEPQEPKCPLNALEKTTAVLMHLVG